MPSTMLLLESIWNMYNMHNMYNTLCKMYMCSLTAVQRAGNYALLCCCTIFQAGLAADAAPLLVRWPPATA